MEMSDPGSANLSSKSRSLEVKPRPGNQGAIRPVRRDFIAARARQAATTLGTMRPNSPAGRPIARTASSRGIPVSIEARLALPAQALISDSRSGSASLSPSPTSPLTSTPKCAPVSDRCRLIVRPDHSQYPADPALEPNCRATNSTASPCRSLRPRGNLPNLPGRAGAYPGSRTTPNRAG